jgi:hypothetical protein
MGTEEEGQRVPDAYDAEPESYTKVTVFNVIDPDSPALHVDPRAGPPPDYRNEREREEAKKAIKRFKKEGTKGSVDRWLDEDPPTHLAAENTTTYVRETYVGPGTAEADRAAQAIAEARNEAYRDVKLQEEGEEEEEEEEARHRRHSHHHRDAGHHGHHNTSARDARARERSHRDGGKSEGKKHREGGHHRH